MEVKRNGKLKLKVVQSLDEFSLRLGRVEFNRRRGVWWPSRLRGGGRKLEKTKPKPNPTRPPPPKTANQHCDNGGAMHNAWSAVDDDVRRRGNFGRGKVLLGKVVGAAT